MKTGILRSNPDFRRLWTGETVSLFGDQISLLALPLTAVTLLNASPAQMGYLTAAVLIPNLLFSLHFGAWADRQPSRRRIMIMADVGRALVLASVPAGYLLGILSFVQLLTVGLLSGTLSVLFSVSHPSVFASVVTRKDYVKANQLLNGSRAFSFLSGMSVGGLLVQALSAPIAVLVDAFSFVGSALFVGRIRTAEAPPPRREDAQISAGIRFIRGNPILLSSLIAMATVNFFNFIFWALYILFATNELHIGSATLGLVLGAASVGSIIGSLVTGRIASRTGIGAAFVIGAFLFTTPLVLVPLARGPQPLVLGMLFAAEFISGFGVMLLDITAGSMKTAIVPDALRARVSGAYNVVNYGVRPIGSLVGGALGTLLGLRPALWIAAVGAVLGVLILLPSPTPRLRELPEAPAE